jgi:Tc toxin complex TcA C-terminal TcB-binding domain
MTPSFNVPAQYFYALTANLPIDVDVDVRYRMAVSSSSKRIVDGLRTAIDAGIIPAALPITPEQAARRLDALGSDAGTGPICSLNVGSQLVAPPGGWLAYVNATPTDDPEVDIAPFWSKVLAPLGSMSLSHPDLAKGHLELVVCAIIKEGDPSLLLAALQAEGLTLSSVKDLDPQAFAGPSGITFDQWKQVFQSHPGAIPLFARIGVSASSPDVALTEQTSAFVRRLSQFFNLPAVAIPVPTAVASALPELVKPDYLHDLMALFVSAYTAQPGQAGFAFGQIAALDPASAQAAAALVLPTDPVAATWLIEAASKVNALYAVADVAGVADALRFSIAEALHARGFVSVDSIAALTPDDFQDALIGTVAYPYAQQIQAKAGSAATSSAPPAGPFGPINDGTLTNCVPPPWLSPLGPVAYLHDLWTLSETATCEAPGGDGKAFTLGDAVATRRGPLGDLLATQANLETGLPRVDLVNECLEQLVAGGSVSAVYQTSGTALAGHLLARPDAASDDFAVPLRHDPERLFAAVPEHSSPGAGLAAAYVKLRDDFSAPVLPYSQPLDLNRSYLNELRTSRFATMRRFRKDITEFVLDSDPDHQPVDFASYRWRYPVRVDIAREYLGISPEEYAKIFTTDIDPALLAELYGFAPGTPSWMTNVTRLSELLPRTGLTYCELIELWRSGFVAFEHRAATRERENRGFPLCEPCYLDKHAVVFQDPAKDLARLIVFIRLWQKLSRVRGAGYTFTQLADIASVLELFLGGGAINPDFIRQLAAFQMLRDDFDLPLVDERDPAPGTGVERTHLLALFAMPPAGTPVPRKWSWAIGRLIDRIGHHARSEHHAEPRLSEFIKMLSSNLDPLSRLAGFDPSTPDRTWHARPTHALRFAEVLSKIYASRFGVGEILFLFTVEDALEGDDPFRLPTEEESLDSPLDLPDDGRAFSLWSLRRALRDVNVSDEDVHAWTWPRIERSLREELGFALPAVGPDPVLELGRHFFPEHLEHTGTTAAPKGRQYRQHLLATDTSPAMWNAPGDGPFRYDTSAQELWTAIPLKDESVLEKLSRIRQLSTTESQVLRELYFLPRVDLARFAFVFVSFDEAIRCLIEEADEHRRWAYFQRSFAYCHARCQLIAKHLAEHVSAAIGEHDRHDEHRHDHDHLAWRILKQLLADENAPKSPAPWESDAGKPPAAVTWQPSGSAFAAILGLLGTGLLGELRREGSSNVIWRELRGPMDPFGHVLNHWNVPVPTVLPALNAVLSPAQAGFADVRNGILIANSGVRPLGGVEGYCAQWTGVLLVDEAGPHQFFAGAPTGDGERPDAARAHGMCWRVKLRRGQKSWIVLARGWPNEEDCGDRSSHLPLKRGAYTIDIELSRCPPEYPDADDVHPLRSGFELAYVGPDTDGRVVPLPHHRLFLEQKTGTLGAQIDERNQGAAKLFLDTRYVSTLRDVRRTYQRAFKALLFARRFELSARTFADYGQSEIGYLLDYPDRFEGISFYWKAGAWETHRAWFDLDFFPIRDPYHPPAGDDRASPSVPRQQALFDGWERMFDYTALRRRAKAKLSREIWLLFDDASDSPTQDPKQLVHYMGINATFAPLVLTFDIGYPVVATDLQDERWLIRVWRAEEWVRRIESAFLFKDLREARPDLWASDDPSSNGGNDNLTKVFQDGCIENGPPRRYADLKRLNDGLRERARQAMVAYLCGPTGGTGAPSAKELGERLLIDVEVGLCERASRIEEGVTAVQLFERRARLGLEPTWSPSPGFALLWDRSFATFHTWQACERKDIYRENWIEWSELEKARRTEGFRFLESELRRASLTVPVPGGLTYWDDARPPAHPGLQLLQAREPATIELVPTQPEALNLLGTPERSARRSWLASVAGVVKPPPRDPTGGQDRPRLTAASVMVAPLPPRAATATGKLPLWIESAIRLGVRLLRVAAAGVPPASNAFTPRHGTGEEGCCVACGQRHEAVADEYYFWLVDSRYFSTDDIRQEAGSNWDDDPGAERADLPKLLSWTSKPSVHLMWSRMHDGQLQQPRRSTEGVAVNTTGQPWTLELTGRKADSLYFKVNGALTAAAGLADTPDVGFRYDLATDSAVVVPEVAPDPTVSLSIGGLFSYPYFAYFEPGAPLAPLSMFSESVAVACALRSHCRFEAALRWYEAFFAPLTHDNRWCWESVPRQEPIPPRVDDRINIAVVGAESAPSLRIPPVLPPLNLPPIETDRESMCCRYSFVTDDVARRRAITLDYVETLLEWGDAIMRRNAPEAFQQARLVFDTASKILGPRPPTVLDEETLLSPTPPTVASFNAALIGVPLNPRLLALYDCAVDRLASIHACLDDRRLRNGQSSEDMPYWGTDARRRRWAADHVCSAGCGHEEVCADEGDWCDLPSPYRFTFLTQKALGLASEVRSFGASLLSAFEKGDAEHLAYVRASHERQLVELTLAIREDAWRGADWDVQALKKSKEVAQNQLQYYVALIAAGLNSGENDYVGLTNGSIAALTAATVSETIGTVLGVIPDIFVGTTSFVQLPIGSKLAGVFNGVGQIAHTASAILSTTAGLRMTQSGWERRDAEWHHQVDVFTIEIEQIERQILAAQRRRDSAAHELDNTRRQIEQSREMLDLLRDKFTSQELYLHLQKETAALHRQTYELALRAARQAQRAFNFERGYTSRQFIPGELWQDLREGLLAGERLGLALQRMEKAYCDENVREYELTKHISLRQIFPAQFLQLKTTGRCEIEIPEWLFDLDYPGQYLRRIKNVALTIPCVVGPYTGVHCRLTLLASTTRVLPSLLEPIAACCKEAPAREPLPASPCGCWSEPLHAPHPKEADHASVDTGYAARPEDPRIVRRYGAKEAIATSSGQNDPGLFQLDFRDERYLPFEFEGAVSRFRIELPPENNYFDMDTLSDVVLHLNYTAREGGEVLRKAASVAAQRHVPDAGRRVIDVRQELTDAWRRFQAERVEDGARRGLELRLGRDMFLFLPGHRDVSITRLEVFFEAPDAEPGRHREIELCTGHRRGCKHAERDDVRQVDCVASAEWPGFYRGVLDVHLGPLSWRERDLIGILRFHPSHGIVREVYIVCSYETIKRPTGQALSPERRLPGGHMR